MRPAGCGKTGKKLVGHAFCHAVNQPRPHLGDLAADICLNIVGEQGAAARCVRQADIRAALFDPNLSRSFDKRSYEQGNIRDGVVSIAHGAMHRARRRVENTQFRADVLRLYERELFPKVMNTLLDAAFPKGARNYWKSAFFKELSADVISVLVDAFERVPSPMSGMVIEHFHGAVTRIDPTATAYPHREPGFNLVLTGEWLDLVVTLRGAADGRGPSSHDAKFLRAIGRDGCSCHAASSCRQRQK